MAKIRDINSKDWNAKHRAVEEISNELEEYQKDNEADKCIQLLIRFSQALKVDCIIE